MEHLTYRAFGGKLMTLRTIFIIWFFINHIFLTYEIGRKKIAAAIEDIDSVSDQYPDKFINIKPGNIIRKIYKIKTKTVFRTYYIILVIISVLTIFASFECIMSCYMGGFTKEIFLKVFYIHHLQFLMPELIFCIFVIFHCNKLLKDKQKTSRTQQDVNQKIKLL